MVPLRRPGRPMGLGKPPGSGRRLGVPNKVTATIKALALPYARRAFAMLARLLKTSGDDKVRLAAAREILDRAYGRPVSPTEVTGKDGSPIVPPELPRGEIIRRLTFLLASAEREAERDEAAASENTAPPSSTGQVMGAAPALLQPPELSSTETTSAAEKFPSPAEILPPVLGSAIAFDDVMVVNVGAQRDGLADCYEVRRAGAVLIHGNFEKAIALVTKINHGRLPPGRKLPRTPTVRDPARPDAGVERTPATSNRIRGYEDRR